MYPPDLFPGENATAIDDLFANGLRSYSFPDATVIAGLLKPRDPAAHKGDFGHALLIAGSEGKTGAALLASGAALRTGCGLLTAAIPENARTPLLTRLPEAMTMVRNDAAAGKTDLSRFSAVGFGPGVGMDAVPWLELLLQQTALPLVIDADGLTLLSKQKAYYASLSPRILLTPHAGEFDRITQPHSSGLERFRTQLGFSKANQVYVLLKGQYTSITTPEGDVYFNTTGNSGMATAGSGDVLTGILCSLLAQGYAVRDAAILGAWLHGYAGDTMAAKRSQTALIASDIVDGIGEFFLRFGQ